MSKRIRFLAIAFALVVSFVASLAVTHSQDPSSYKVAFLLADSPTDQGWNAAHYRGIEQLKNLGEVVREDGLSFDVLIGGMLLQVQVVESVGYNDADIERDARQVITGGANYIWGTWWDSQGAMSRLAEEFPTVLFEHGSGYPFVQSNGRNFSTYFIRMEEGDYVAGYAIGLQGHAKVGLVGTYPIPEPVRGANGFTLGLQRGLQEAGLDPSQAEVQVLWLNTWLDREKETQAARALLDQGYRVIRQMADTPYSSQTTCDVSGAIAVGYGTNVLPVAPCTVVTNEWNWGGYYVARVEDALEGAWEPQDWWGGFAEGAVVMTGWNENVPSDVQTKANALVQSIADGSFNPFCGPIHGSGLDTVGNEVPVEVPDGKCLSDMDLLTMQWLVDGIVGAYPPAPQGGHVLQLVDVPSE